MNSGPGFAVLRALPGLWSPWPPGRVRLRRVARRVLLLILLAPCAPPAAALDPVVIDGVGGGSYPLEPHMEVYRDTDRNLDLDGIHELAATGRFEPLPERTGANLGLVQDVIWLRFRLRVEPEAAGTLILEIPYAHLDRITLYVPDAAPDQRVQHSGDRLPFAQRRIPYRMPAFDLDLPADQVITGYLRIEGEGSIQAPAVLWHEDRFRTATSQEAYLLGLYYGVLLAMALYNLLVFTSLRDRNYLYYVGAIVSIGLFAFTMNGLSYQYLWPEYPVFTDVAMPLFIALGNFALLQFSRSFLDVRRYLPAVARIMLALQIASAAMVVGTFFLPYQVSASTLPVLVLASTLIIIGSAIFCWLRGERQARYFVLGWAVFLFGAMSYALSTHGLLPSNVFTRNGVQIGSAIEMILLAFALSDRMLLLQRENEEIRTEATRRLLRDLHDGMGRHFIQLIRSVENESVPRTHLRADLRQAFADMRLLVSSTEPHLQDIAIGLSAIRDQFDGILRDHGIAWNWQVSLPHHSRDQCPKRTLNVLRIVQEALTNSIKYAQASTITVRAFEDGERATVIEVEDDGTASWDPSETGNGSGIRHMYQRALNHNIEIDIGGAIAGVRLRVPRP